MKRFFRVAIIFVLSSVAVVSCTDRDDIIYIPEAIQVQSFIWKGLNQYYLWQADVPDLADNLFATQNDLNAFLQTKGTPENIFQNLLNKPISQFPIATAVDRFSILVNDYTVLENLFQGVSTSTGMSYGRKLKVGSSTEIFGWVKYVLPNSSAASKNVTRGMIFYAVNGIQLTTLNYSSLLGLDAFTINLADYDGGNITPNGTSISLTKSVLNENPVYFAQTFTIGARKIGYLVYNSFTSNNESQLNAAFGQFKAAGVTHLVLDLRYNPGGAVKTAARLASMITGQFSGQVFANIQWNSKIQTFFQANNPDQLVEKFPTTLADGSNINSLNLTKLYVITSDRTASASELVINGLAPYISIVKIGDTTIGKNVGSITLYDSPNFSATNRNPNHKYAMQPLVIKLANKNGFSDYQNGIIPNYLMPENLGDLGQLGNTTEPLLSATLTIIANGGRFAQPNYLIFKDFKDEKSIQGRFESEMYLEKMPSFTTIK